MVKGKDANSRPVYSSEQGRLCPDCGQPVRECRCRKRSSAPAGDGIVRLSRQTKGRKGKGVTLVTGVPLADDQLKDLAKALKQKCGSGGTVKDGVIEIQGDHRETLMAELKKKGWTVKKAGG
ncbi:MAG: translation initiation factor Sui1 [Desulfuromonadales bacterium]|nr:translation initiation factor Sui1 [Desulfuromonadales bacterium]NIR33853.1 translation initiation factor Sui1 [Desulfuromonadales bacterium]NIS40004.1 translation initiation factor Sui1 [Desulfuromonadales bacterium]